MVEVSYDIESASHITHWGRVTHICVSKLTIIGSDNGLSPGRRQAIIWTNAGILLIRTLGTNFSEILSEIYAFSFKKMHLRMSSAKWRPFCLGLNVINNLWRPTLRTCKTGLLKAVLTWTANTSTVAQQHTIRSERRRSYWGTHKRQVK